MPRVYLGTCAIQRPLDGREQARVRAEADAVTAVLAAVSAGTVDLATSAALRIESERGTDPVRRPFARRVLLLATHDVPSTDALHLASAVASNADFLCTTDGRFLLAL